jgi:hypothetical protein
MRTRQQGITAISFIVVAAFVGIFAFGILKVTPFYLEQMKVSSILENVKKELDGTKTSVSKIRTAIGKRLDIEMVNGINVQEFTIKKIGVGYMVQAKYERREAFIGNLYLLAAFDEQVEITR